MLHGSNALRLVEEFAWQVDRSAGQSDSLLVRIVPRGGVPLELAHPITIVSPDG